MKKETAITFIIFRFLFFGGTMENNPVITTGSLFEEMIELRGLAFFPEPAYKTV